MASLAGCPTTAANDDERLCTPRNYVFCRCADRSEGTKRCSDTGDSFSECDCGDPWRPPPLSPDGDASFTPIDAALPADAGPTLDDRCAGKLAVLASSNDENDLFLYGAVYAGKGEWNVGKSQGAALRSAPRGGLVNNTLVAVWRTRFDRIAWTKFEVNQTSLSPPVDVGYATTSKMPAFVGGPADGRLYHLAKDGEEADDGGLHPVDLHQEGSYDPTGRWDATAPLPTGQSEIPGKSGPSAALVGTSHVVAFAGSDDTLAVQTETSGKWDAPAPIAGAQALPQTPALVALKGGAEDLLIVYVSSDLTIRSTARNAATKKWSTPLVVDTLASATGYPALTPLGNGRALVVWKAVNGKPFFSVYDPDRMMRWTNPSAFFGGSPRITTPPTVSAGRCASEATAAYVAEETGEVYVALFGGGKWSGPFVVPGLSKMAFAGAGEVP